MNHRDFCKYLVNSIGTKGKLLVVKTGVMIADAEKLMDRKTYSHSIVSEGEYYKAYNPKGITVVILIWADGTMSKEEFDF